MNKEEIEEFGDNHILSDINTPLRSDAYEKTDEQKIENIQFYFQ